MAPVVKNSPANAGDLRVRSLVWEDPLKKGTATHSSILAWIPWTEDLSSLQSMGSQRVGHDWTTFTYTSIRQPETILVGKNEGDGYLDLTVVPPPNHLLELSTDPSKAETKGNRGHSLGLYRWPSRGREENREGWRGASGRYLAWDSHLTRWEDKKLGMRIRVSGHPNYILASSCLRI